jgi:LPXTG-motif cell wall-anchored protein
MRRFLVPLAAAAFLALVAPATASAQPYPAGTPNLTASPGTVTVGGTVTVTGSGFAPGDTVTLTVTYTPTALGPRGAGAMVPVAYEIPLRLAQQVVTPDANGDFTTTETLTQVGTATITATSVSGLTASTSVLVLAGAALPTTGASTNYLLVALVGSAVIAAGVLFLVLARSRRRQEPEPSE